MMEPSLLRAWDASFNSFAAWRLAFWVSFIRHSLVCQLVIVENVEVEGLALGWNFLQDALVLLVGHMGGAMAAGVTGAMLSNVLGEIGVIVGAGWVFDIQSAAVGRAVFPGDEEVGFVIAQEFGGIVGQLADKLLCLAPDSWPAESLGFDAGWGAFGEGEFDDGGFVHILGLQVGDIFGMAQVVGLVFGESDEFLLGE